jgi:hypothetical protein
MADAFDAIGDLNSVIDPLVSAENLGDSLFDSLPSIDSCLTELIVSLALAQDQGLSESKTKKAIIEALVSPIEELRSSLKELFVPDSAALSDAANGSESMISAYSKQVFEAMKNPFAALMQQQKAVFQAGLEQVGDILMSEGDQPGQRGLVNQVYDRVEFILRELFVNEQRAGSSMGGLLIYAIEEAIPGIDAELRYLKKMRDAVTVVEEESSKLPPSMVPQLPNLWASSQLCASDDHLRKVSHDLEYNSTWNRGAFEDATEAVCKSAEALRTGLLPTEGREFVKNLTGWDDRQLNAIGDMSFMPNVEYRLMTLRITQLNVFVQRQDVHVLTFHRNLKNALDTLESLTSIGVGHILSLVVQVLRAQIQAVEADLNAGAQGFTGALPAGVPDKVGADPGSEGGGRDNAKYATDVFAQLSQQATGYVVLEALCFLMDKVKRIQSGLDQLLDVNNTIMKAVKDFVRYYKTEEDCGVGDNGADIITQKMHTFLTYTERRLRGDTISNEFLGKRAQELKDAITDHEKWLVCMRNNLFFGNENIGKAITGVANALSVVKNISNLVRKMPQLEDAIRNFDLRKMMGLDEDAEFNPIDAVMRALQCLLLRCGNSYISSTATLVQEQFKPKQDARHAGNMTMGRLDEVPKQSRLTGENLRINAFMRAIAALQKLTSLDLEELCNIDTSPSIRAREPGDPAVAPDPPAVTAVEGEPEDVAAKARETEIKREQAVQDAKPFGDGSEIDFSANL